MSLLQRIFPWIGSGKPAAPARAEGPTLPAEPAARSTERGMRATPENALKYLYRVMWVDPDVRQAIIDIREMDALDGRVKRIHNRTARDAIKGGLIMQQSRPSESVAREWERFRRRLQLDQPGKLKSDARGLVMEGNLPMQWVLDEAYRVVGGVRMPSETILPNVDGNGRLKDVRRAYLQVDLLTGAELAVFPLWQLLLARYDPDNHDDLGCMGRPFLDASRSVWRKLRMSDEDLVIRRRVRAPLRMVHFLKGATKDELEEYRARVEGEADQITTDYFSNKEGTIQSVQGDANLDAIKDVSYLLDTFFTGSPLPKGLAGYTDGLARDILEDLKRDYFDEIDHLQDTLAWVYEQGFRLHLLLQGQVPDEEDFCIKFAERRTETPNQAADRALKWQALGLPRTMVWQELGQDPAYVRELLEYEAKEMDPYPDPDAIREGRPGPRVSITPGNARKGESGTAISNG